MSALHNNKINTLERVLKNTKRVEFQKNGLFYEIFESSNDGYEINIYSKNSKSDNGEYCESDIIDGGTCTGSARDAIEFML